MKLIGIIVGAAIAIYIWVLICREFQKVAEYKGFTEERYYWITFFLGIVGILLVIALPDRGVNMSYNADGAQSAIISDELPDL